MQGEAPRRPHTLIKIPSDVNEELGKTDSSKSLGRGPDDGLISRHDAWFPQANMIRFHECE